MAKANQWDKLERETGKAFAAFILYRDLGPSRTVNLVAQKLGRESKNNKALLKWCRENDWVRRAGAYDAHLQKLKDMADEEVLVKMAKQGRKQRSKNVFVATGIVGKELEKYKRMVDSSPGPILELRDLIKLAKIADDISRHEYTDGDQSSDPPGLDGLPDVDDLDLTAEPEEEE